MPAQLNRSMEGSYTGNPIFELDIDLSRGASINSKAKIRRRLHFAAEDIDVEGGSGVLIWRLGQERNARDRHNTKADNRD
jgi:hypothetical protein